MLRSTFWSNQKRQFLISNFFFIYPFVFSVFTFFSPFSGGPDPYLPVQQPRSGGQGLVFVFYLIFVIVPCVFVFAVAEARLWLSLSGAMEKTQPPRSQRRPQPRPQPQPRHGCRATRRRSALELTGRATDLAGDNTVSSLFLRSFSLSRQSGQVVTDRNYVNEISLAAAR